MSDPGYDFFATGRPQVPPGSPPLPPPPVAPPAPAPVAPPVDAVYNAPPPAAQFTRADGVTVNQFGTPIGTASAPTGPYAAPGVGSVPTQAPGMVSSWPGPQTAPAPYAGRRAAAPGAGVLPRNVRAVAFLALFFGLLIGWATFNAFGAYLQLSDAIDAAGGASAYGASVLTTLLGLLLLSAAVTVALFLGGGATLAGRRWGGWILVVAYSLYVVGQLVKFVDSGFGLMGLVGVAISVALLLALVTGEGLAWLRGQRS